MSSFHRPTPHSQAVKAYGRRQVRYVVQDPDELARSAFAHIHTNSSSSALDSVDGSVAPPPPARPAAYHPVKAQAVASAVHCPGSALSTEPVATTNQDDPNSARNANDTVFKVPSTPATHRIPPSTPQPSNRTPAPALSHSHAAETPLDQVERRLSFLSVRPSSSSPRTRHDLFEPLVHDLSHLTPIRPASALDSYPPSPIPQKQPSLAPSTLHSPSLLNQLLDLSTTRDVLRFSDMFTHHGWVESGIAKIGEASYSDVFRIDDVVIKIMPFAMTDPTSPVDPDASHMSRRMSARMTRHTRRQSLAIHASSASHSRNHHHSAHPDELRPIATLVPELQLARTVSRLAGFVPMRAAHIVHDVYTPAMLNAWHTFADTHPHDALNAPPATHAPGWYCVVIMPHAGQPLDAFPLTKAKDLRSVLVQVAEALALGEREVGFEHRDLHCGNVLVRPGQGGGAGGEVEVKLIDWTLSRVHGVWVPIPEDVFGGEGDAQFDLYRAMREVVERDGGGDWAGFFPKTNVLWLGFLVSKLANKSRSLQFRKAIKQLEHELHDCASAQEAVEAIRQLPVVGPK